MKLINKKTGVIADLSEGFIKDTYNGEFIQIKPVAISDTEGYLYSSLAELNEEWEDYKSEEPLIKDKEIREIIRAWADVNDAGRLKYDYDENSLNDIYRNSITFNCGLSLKDGGEYTIAELCGEVENA